LPNFDCVADVTVVPVATRLLADPDISTNVVAPAVSSK
jgi:hypothetical protein